MKGRIGQDQIGKRDREVVEQGLKQGWVIRKRYLQPNSGGCVIYFSSSTKRMTCDSRTLVLQMDRGVVEFQCLDLLPSASLSLWHLLTPGIARKVLQMIHLSTVETTHPLPMTARLTLITSGSSWLSSGEDEGCFPRTRNDVGRRLA